MSIAKIKVNKLPDVPREATKAQRIDIYSDLMHYYQIPEVRPNEEEIVNAIKITTKNKRGKDQAKRRKTRPWTQDDVNELIRLHREGLSHRQIAEKLGRSKGNVSNRLKMAKEGRLW